MKTQIIENYCREILIQELTDRKRKNPMYSLRAFARDLDIGSTSLSDALANKRNISKRNIFKIAEKLSWTPGQVEQILSQGKPTNHSAKRELERVQLEDDSFRLISDWYFLATLNLAKIKSNFADALWVSKRLEISVYEAENAITRLVRMGLIEIRSGTMHRTSKAISTSNDIPSSAIRKHHRDHLNLADKTLDSSEIEKREFSSVTMAVNPHKLSEAKKILAKAKRKVADLMETDDPTEVYVLSLQLFPLTKSKPLIPFSLSKF